MYNHSNLSSRRVFPAAANPDTLSKPSTTTTTNANANANANATAFTSATTEGTSNIYGFNRLMMLRELNANYDNDRPRNPMASTGGGGTSAGESPLAGIPMRASRADGVSASQNHRERIEQEAKRRKELEKMQQEDYIFKAEGAERAKRRHEQLAMQQEERRTLALIQLDRETKHKQQLLAQQQLEMAQKEQYLLKIQEQKREQERLAKDKEEKRRAAAEQRMKDMKEAADAKLREKYRREQEAVEAEARKVREQELAALEAAQREAARMRQLEMESLESASMQVEDQFSLNYRRYLIMEQERLAQLALNEAKWKEFEANQAKQLKMETDARRAERAEKARLYDETQKKKMAKHQLASSSIKDKTTKQPSPKHNRPLATEESTVSESHSQVLAPPPPQPPPPQEQQLQQHQEQQAPSQPSLPASSKESGSPRVLPEETNPSRTETLEAPQSSTRTNAPALSDPSTPSQSISSAPDLPTLQQPATTTSSSTSSSSLSSQESTQPASLATTCSKQSDEPKSKSVEKNIQQEPVTPAPTQPEPMAGPSLMELSTALQVAFSVHPSQIFERNLVPFAKVLAVAALSPAMDANLQSNDLVVEFDGVINTTPKSLVRMGEVVQCKVNQPLHLTVLRPKTSTKAWNDAEQEYLVVQLQLVPHKWAGKGLLGCNLAPFKAEECKPKQQPEPDELTAAPKQPSTIDSPSNHHAQPQPVATTSATGKECAPFLVIDNVRPGSPANQAGLLQGDLVVEFEGICSETPNRMKLVAQKVASLVNAQVHLRVARKCIGADGMREVCRLVELVLVPQKWSGEGLLGCRIAPYSGPPVQVQLLVAQPPSALPAELSPTFPHLNQQPACSASHDDSFFGCLVFYQIADDSPAQEAGLMDGDILMTCGPLTSRPLDHREVQQYLLNQVDQRVPITIQRLSFLSDAPANERPEAETFDLCLVPQQWMGDGILGCSLTTFEFYYDVAHQSPISHTPTICEACWYSVFPTCAHAAAWSGHVECLEALALMDDPSMYQLLFSRDEQGRNPLFYACSANHVPCVIVLWDETYAPKHPVTMVDPDHSFLKDQTDVPPHNLTSLLRVTCDYFGDTLLHAATSTNAIDVLRLLLEHGADPDVGNLDQMTPAHVAANAASLRILKAFGADLLMLDVYGKLPLSYACMVGNADSVRFLCDSHDDFVDYADQEGNTPLHLAVLYDHLEVIQVLVKYLAPIAFYLPNSVDMNPMQLSTNPDVVTLLDAYYDPSYEPPS